MANILESLATLFLVITAWNEAMYIHIASDVGWRMEEGKELCENMGMSLPVLKTQAEFDQFVSYVHVVAASMGVAELQLWLGLTYDESNETSADHFMWTDGQRAAYLVVSPADFNFYSNETRACVRLYNSRMRVTSCNWRRELLCQGGEWGQVSESPTFPNLYVKMDVTYGPYTSTSRFVLVKYEKSGMGCLDWLSLWTASLPVLDTTDCFLSCAQNTSCSFVAVSENRTRCFSSFMEKPCTGN